MLFGFFSSHINDSVVELEEEEIGDVRGGVDPIQGPPIY